MNQYERNNVEQIKEEIMQYEKGKCLKKRKHILFIEEWDRLIHIEKHMLY